MTGRAQISCIKKDPRQDRYHSITQFGGVNPDGTRWTLSMSDILAHYDKGWTFYTQVGGHTREVRVHRSPSSNRYLKTDADADTPDNLLSLPECY